MRKRKIKRGRGRGVHPADAVHGGGDGAAAPGHRRLQPILYLLESKAGTTSTELKDSRRALGGVPREQQMLKGHLPRVMYIPKYTDI